MKHARDKLADGYSIDFQVGVATPQRKEHSLIFPNLQDLVSRFTLDSAAEFLFGYNVGSLSAGIPYPPGKENTESFKTHPSTEFVNAFMEGQIRSVERLGLGTDWPLAEFLEDKVAPLRRVIDRFVEPVMLQAREKKLMELSQKGGSTENEDNTLLSHLVKHTQGESRSILLRVFEVSGL